MSKKGSILTRGRMMTNMCLDLRDTEEADVILPCEKLEDIVECRDIEFVENGIVWDFPELNVQTSAFEWENSIQNTNSEKDGWENVDDGDMTQIQNTVSNKYRLANTVMAEIQNTFLEKDRSANYDDEDMTGIQNAFSEKDRSANVAGENTAEIENTDGKSNKVYKVTKRKNCCPFCSSIITNFSRHIISKHPNEKKVQEYLSVEDTNLKERKIKRQAIANHLRNEGNYIHNKKIINSENCDFSELLPVKRPRHNKFFVTNKTHVTCKWCFGLFNKSTFYHHYSSSCKQNDSHVQKPLRICAELLVPNFPGSDNLRKYVFSKMYKDEISLVAQSDPLILKFGSRFFMHHQEKHQINYVSSKLRDLAKVLLEMKKLNSKISNMVDCLAPENFDYLMEAIRNLCCLDKETGMCKTPSITTRLRSSLISCADIVRMETIKAASLNDTMKKKVYNFIDDFMHLIKKEWVVQVSHNADKSRRIANVSKVDILPDSTDIKTLCSFLDKECDKAVMDLKNCPTLNKYEYLSKIIVAYLIILNRRRPGEVVSAKLKHYNSINENEDFGLFEETVLNDSDKYNCKTLFLFYIPANKNKNKVPVILTEKLKTATDLLINVRTTLKINSELLFPRPFSNSTYSGTDIISEFKSKVILKKPTHFTATGLRHHAATSTQLHKKNENYAHSLAKFMGHTLQTHKGYYEMPLPVIQKLLIGKDLVKMTESTTAPTSQEVCPLPDIQGAINLESDLINDSIQGSTKSNEENNALRKAGPGNCKVTSSTSNEPLNSSHTDLSSNDDDDELSISPKKSFKKVRWSSEEKEVIYKWFGKMLLVNESPRRCEIKEIWSKEKSLQSRTLQQVCTYVNNIVKKKVKILTPDKRRIKEKYF